MEPQASVVPRGEVKFQVSNESDAPHSFVLLRTDEQLDRLPVEGGVIVEDDLDVRGRIDDIPPHGAGEAIFALTPGRHVLVCDRPGHHALGGVLELTVQPVEGAQGSKR